VNKFNFNDLLPGSIKDDPKFKAISECLDDAFENFKDNLQDLIIFARIDSLEENILDDLAWEWNLSYHDGYSLLADIEEKRNLIRNAIILKKHKGTRWSIERIGELLNMPITIIEWWENYENSTELQPFEFDVSVDANQRGVSDEFYEKAIKLISSLKNSRSHMRRIQARLFVSGNFHIGAIGRQVTLNYVYPENFEDILDVSQQQ